MDFQTFKAKVQTEVPVGKVFDNPGGGTSEVLSVSEHAITYRRGNSSISVSLQDLFDPYQVALGRRLSSRDLRLYAPSVFDSQARPAGHSCNATFLFLVLQHLGVVKEIKGGGVKGDSYFVDIPG